VASSRERELAAAAAGLAGAAAVGGKLALSKRAGARRRSKTEQAFRLHKDELVPDGIRRIARGQLDAAHARLDGRPRRKLATGVHETRKSFKRLRATARLARGAIGEETYARENAAFRDAGRRLSGVRDATVLIETLDALIQAAGAELPDGVTGELHRRLEGDRDQAVDALKADDELVAALTGDIERARLRTATWTFATDGFAALEPGLQKIYRRGRDAMRRAQAEPTDEHLHEWRKRVKDLWHAEQILRSEPAKRTHALADLLGDDHDLAELRRYAAARPDAFDGTTAKVALLAIIDRRRAALQRKAFALGSKLYRRSPRRFVEAAV
jgi:hypothetical protein